MSHDSHPPGWADVMMVSRDSSAIYLPPLQDRINNTPGMTDFYRNSKATVAKYIVIKDNRVM